MATPDYDSYVQEILGWPDEVARAAYGGVVGILVGTNPPYTLVDLLNVYPKFFGSATAVTGNLTLGSDQLNMTDSPLVPVAAGMLVVDANLPNGTVILSVAGNVATLSNNATATVSGEKVAVYMSPVLPLIVIAMYITLASASLVQARWQEMWQYAMALYIAHYCTLYLRSEGNPGSTAGQIANSGLEKGVMVSRGTGPLSASIQLPSGLEEWGAWTQTTYGAQLATLANTMGSGFIGVR